MMALTHLPPVSLPVLLLVTTGFFVLVSGRMVPGMALLTATPPARLRGGFMSVNNAIMSASMGVASWIGGMLIGRTPEGLVTGYERCGWLALVTSVLLVIWVGQLKPQESDSATR
jgi:predicted MFS family arabinose efflux permease